MSHPLLKKDSFHRRIRDPVFYDGAFLEKAKSNITDTLAGKYLEARDALRTILSASLASRYLPATEIFTKFTVTKVL